MAKLISAKCPTCGANMPVPPGIPQLTCRYCQNVITVEVRQAPTNITPFGMPGGMPSRTLYVDPAALKAAQQASSFGLIIMLVVFGLPFIIGIGAAVGPCALRSCKGAIRPFPIACGINEEVEASGNWEGTGPVVTSAGVNCKLHIKNAKLKATSFLPVGQSNIQVTLENVQLETTDTMFKGGANGKVKVTGSTLTSQAEVFDTDSNLEVTLDNSTVESKGGTAFKSKYNMKVHASASKIRGKKAAFDTQNNFELDLKKASEVTSSDGPAIKATSGMKLEAEGGKIDGAGGAIVTESSLTITATGLTITSAKEKAIQTTSSLKLDLTDGFVTSTADAAIENDGSSEFILVNSTVQGTIGIEGKSSQKLKATKKSRVVGTSGFAFLGTSSLDLSLAESSLEGATKALKGTSSVKIKLGPGARIVGKQGAIEAESSFQLDATGASIEGGAGIGILTTSGATVAVKQGVLKGNPAIQSSYAITPDLTGSRVEGATVVVNARR